MIIVKFGGGLGNQLFQYAMLQSLKKFNPDIVFKCDVSGYMFFNEHNGFEIDKYFEFNEQFASLKDLQNIKPILNIAIRIGIQCKSLAMFNKYLKVEKLVALFRGKKNRHIIFVEDKGAMMYNPSAINCFSKGDYYYDGGWQNPYYYDFSYLRSVIKFKICMNEYEKKISYEMRNKLSISIHIRRGDFISNSKVFDLCSPEYYNKAIAKVKELFREKEDELFFYFFSDDREFVESNYKFKNMEIVRGSSSGVDLYLMAQCKANIIANSTFSFWGAALNDNDPIVIAPKYFANIAGLLTKLDAPSERWNIIENVQS